ncbi:hypothetical protein ACWDKQ_14475 [Saccharopolyspora sp. NPDC000995]
MPAARSSGVQVSNLVDAGVFVIVGAGRLDLAAAKAPLNLHHPGTGFLLETASGTLPEENARWSSGCVGRWCAS